jgi:hypothetical protein
VSRIELFRLEEVLEHMAFPAPWFEGHNGSAVYGIGRNQSHHGEHGITVYEDGRRDGEEEDAEN